MRLPSDANASGRSFGADEEAAVLAVLRSGTLNCTRGTAVSALEAEIRERFAAVDVRACSSGTAALHAAIAAIDPDPGDEIVTTPVTDMGAITPILYQGAVPVFADVDPLTLNVTPDSVAARIGERTRAVIMTHLFGNPCDADGILAVARERDIPVIEDAAQAWGASYKGRAPGSLGDIGCFSLQQGKHITCGEGGLVVSNDEAYARRARLFVDKAWGYGDPSPDHYFLALNYRMTELQGAVALAQFRKLDGLLRPRLAAATRLREALGALPGILLSPVLPGCVHSYWRFPVFVDDDELPGGVDALAEGLIERGVGCSPRYVRKPAFECEVLKEGRTLGRSSFPLAGLHRHTDARETFDVRQYPGVLQGLNRVIVMPINERYGEAEVDYVTEVFRDVVAELRGERA
jgi:dTDP-4-amino-4,6-dideoxygalactose transaminase